jgi:Type II secretion system protein C
MMPRKLLIINALLVAIAAGSTVYIVRTLLEPMPMPVPVRRGPTSPPARTDETAPSPGASAYTSVAARNLFSPTRTEAPPSAITATSASPAVKPSLFGVVLRDGAPVAYLEDPSTKRVAGYRVGDNVAGGTVQTISADSVVINRPDGNMDVRLRDPGRPRPAPVPVAGVGPGAQPTVAPAPLPGVIPPAVAVPVPGQPVPPQAGVAAQPGVIPPAGQPVQPPGPAIVPGRRPLPPNLLRRLPQGAPADATQQ